MNNGTNRYPITIVLEEDDDDDEEEDDDDVVRALSPPRARSTLQVCFWLSIFTCALKTRPFIFIVFLSLVSCHGAKEWEIL